ncbi:MAG: histidine--tRNA ligase [bacterium]|nr:histidine--tRNA ligase [bacterium]
MISAPRGTSDILPPDSSLWQHIEQCARTLFQRYGYAEIRTPVFEHTELFVRSIGDTTDIVEKEMYTFPDRKGRSLTLRPEGTASVVRACLEHKLFSLGKLLKFFYAGPMFRYERPQSGRQRQFHQIGVELFGTSSPLADAEVIAMMVRFFEATGVRNPTVILNTLGDTDSRSAYRAALLSFVTPHLPNLCPDCQRRAERNILRVLDCKVPSCKAIFSSPDTPRTISSLSSSARAHYTAVRQALDALHIPYTEDPTLVRGLDYYTHTIFEVRHGALGAQDALGGGGRYDNLVREMGGPDVPGVGFAIGVERLVMALCQASVPPTSRAPDVALIAHDEQALRDNLVLADILRGRGLSVLTWYDLQSVKAQMRQANNAKVRWAVIQGEDERHHGLLKLKDMRVGTERLCSLDELVTILSANLPS